MRLAVLSLFAFALSAAAATTPDYSVLAVRQLPLPSTGNATSTDVDTDCFQTCFDVAVSQHRYKQENCNKYDTEEDQQRCACRSPYLSDIKRCLKKCAISSAAVNTAITNLDARCAELKANAAPSIRAPFPAIAFAVVGIVAVGVL